MFDFNQRIRDARVAIVAIFVCLYVCLTSYNQSMRKNKTSNVSANVSANLSSVAIASPDATKTTDVQIASPSVPSVSVPSVKMKSPQITDGCMIGRMSLMRDCVKSKKTHAETLEIVRTKYPFGLCGNNAIKWIAKHYARIESKLNKTSIVPIVATSVNPDTKTETKTDVNPIVANETKTETKTDVNPIASASALIDASKIVSDVSAKRPDVSVKTRKTKTSKK